MAKLIYASNQSLDGWTETAEGDLAWAPPNDDVFAAHTEMMGSVGTCLYGRRMYETMAVWETDPSLGGASDAHAEFARVWMAPTKVVYSSTLEAPTTANTTVERTFDADAVRAMKESADRDLLIGGPTLAGQALDAGLVDEVWIFVYPVILGGRKAALQATTRLDLELIDEERIGASDVVRVRHRVS